jgi:hypothetical protein
MLDSELLAEQAALVADRYRVITWDARGEARFHAGRRAARVTYWITTGQRIVLLTVTAKSRAREDRGDRVRAPVGRWLDVSPRSTRLRRTTTMVERESRAGMRERRLAEPSAAEAYEATGWRACPLTGGNA